MVNLLVLSLIPLIMFALANYYQGLRSGVCFGIIGSLCIALIMWIAFDYLDVEVFVVIVSMAALGLVSLKTNKEIYIKLQPAFVNLFSVAFLLWYELIGDPFFVQIIAKLSNVLDADQLETLSNPRFQEVLSSLGRHMIFWVFVHAGIMVLVAWKGSTKQWLASKALGLPFVSAGILFSIWIFS